MGLRFYRRLPLLPGLRLNLGTRGASVSVGHRGAWWTVGPHGRRTATLGWPGTGLRYTVSSAPGVPRQAVPRAPSAAWGLLLLVAIGAMIVALVALLAR